MRDPAKDGPQSEEEDDEAADDECEEKQDEEKRMKQKMGALDKDSSYFESIDEANPMQ